MSKKREDLTDQIFHRLQAVVINWYKTKETGLTHWFCQCEDNNIVSVNIANLRSGRIKSCGCLNKELVSKREDLTGQLFGRWLAVDINWKRTKETGYTYWNVVCTNDANKGCVSGSSLKSGKSKSCGCWNMEVLHQKGKNNHNWKEKEIIICKQCGEEKEVIPSKKDTQFCSTKCKNKWLSENIKGKNNPCWKNGITPFYNKIRTSKKSREFTQKILKEANYTCLISKEINVALHVHHIEGFARILEENNITTREEAENCEELWDESKVVVLSEEWHLGEKIDNPLAFHRLYGKHNFTEEDFYEWFEFILKLKLLEYKLINFNFWLGNRYAS